MLKAHSHSEIAPAICLSQLMGSVGFSAVLQLHHVNTYIESHITHSLLSKVAIAILPCEQSFRCEKSDNNFKIFILISFFL